MRSETSYSCHMHVLQKTILRYFREYLWYRKSFTVDKIIECILALHYANMSVQYTAIFHGCKNDNFQMKIFGIFLIFAQNIDCGYTLEPPQRGGSNEYPQSMFWSKNKKNMYTRVNPTFSI